ncbi:hypothetical protein OH76DRAFT_620714 [Lentinus brumalis]|uniref:BTB domain-containing protein n=1 Tax=Lentinus brumalis TaxID=2498619 RepID=A0A371D904_9APHY|nr:hypothetical protein OH76DRAFT_620714 [Polyporus brumalis]
MANVRANKRSRTQSDDASEGCAIRRTDEEFWYEDGTVILAAGDVDFRVFKGILAEHSPVFKDMFSLPQPPLANGQFPSPCPIVHLSDSPDDIRALLRVCMPKTSSNPFTQDDPPYETIAGSIRLGHKYEICELVDHALGYLKRYYTVDYSQWKIPKMVVPPRFQLIHAIGVVNLARLTDCETILPTALYQCCQLDGELVKGFARADGTRECLSGDDLALCVAARANLMQESVGIALRICAPVLSISCTHPAHCAVVFDDYLHTGRLDPLAVCNTHPFWSAASMVNGVCEMLCGSCWQMLCERNTSERVLFWDRLPTVLGIEVHGWNAGAAAVL